jgi:hypothetical protein
MKKDIDLRGIADVCDGLSHPVRVAIMEILKEKRELKPYELFKEVQKRFGLTNYDFTDVKHHIVAMTFAGLLGASKDLVRLKKRVDIKLKVEEV